MRKLLIILLILIFLFFIYCFFFRKGGCCIGTSGVLPCDTCNKTVAHWINWNLLFTSGSVGNSAQVIQEFEDSLNKFAKSYNPTSILTFTYHHCPCDSLLTNMDATLVYGSGNTVPPPPTNPNPGPKGDYTLGKNFDMFIPGYLDSTSFNTKNITKNDSIQLIFSGQVSKKGVAITSQNKLLAVIDTGLDSTLFNSSYPQTVWAGNLLWQELLKQTLFDVVIGEPNGLLIDGNAGVTNNPVKHGTAVTEIILRQIFNKNPNRIPQILSIRAFDDSEKGSIYTVSCALSYAIQKKANFVNASWGYFGHEDPVLKRYIRLADVNKIHIIAAAGNTRGKHDQTKVCNLSANAPNTGNSLDSFFANNDTLFYPACFTQDFKNVASVTQLYQPGLAPTSPPSSPFLFPCYYQNYSSNYITLGAFEPQSSQNISECCAFNIPFLLQPIEGSSFATPAMTAWIMAEYVGDQDIQTWIGIHALHMMGAQYTKGGSYQTFHQLR